MWCRKMAPALQNIPTWVLTRHVKSLSWGRCYAGDLLHVRASIPCLLPAYSLCRATQSSLCISWHTVHVSWVPYHKAKLQVFLVGCPDVVPFVGICWGSWPTLQGIYSCCKPRSSCFHPLLLFHLASLAEIFVDTTEVFEVNFTRWPLHLGAFPAASLALGAVLLESHTAQHHDAQRGHGSIWQGKYLDPQGPRLLVLLVVPWNQFHYCICIPGRMGVQHGNAHQ